MQVYGTDDRLIGKVERIEKDAVFISGQRCANDKIARVAGNRLYLKGTYDELAGKMQAGTTTVQDQGTVRVPVYEERLDVDKRSTEMGQATIHKTVESEEVTVPVELRREVVHVEERTVTERPVEPGVMDTAFQEQTIRVPVRGEEAVVEKRAVVTGEVEVKKEQTVERQEVRDTVRKEHVEVDKDYERFRPDFQKNFQKSKAGGRTFEQAEPNYRFGYAAARDKRYAGQDWTKAESALRRDWEARYGTSGDSWEQLRQEIRAAWDRVRDQA